MRPIRIIAFDKRQIQDSGASVIPAQAGIQWLRQAIPAQRE